MIVLTAWLHGCMAAGSHQTGGGTLTRCCRWEGGDEAEVVVVGAGRHKQEQERGRRKTSQI